MSNKIPKGWKASSSSSSRGIDFECSFEVTAAELEVDEEEPGKPFIQLSQMRQLASTAAQLQQCIHRAMKLSSETVWLETFGPVIVDKLWGIRFWEGFANPVMTAYCQKRNLDIVDFRRGMFTAPVPFSRRICWEQELTSQNSKEAKQFPCFFTCTGRHLGDQLSWWACCFRIILSLNLSLVDLAKTFIVELQASKKKTC